MHEGRVKDPSKPGAPRFHGGPLLFLLNPPSLSGAGGFVALIGGAIALMFAHRLGTVALTGRDGMSDREFERLVRRSEELARQDRASGRDRRVRPARGRGDRRAAARSSSGCSTRTPVVVSSRGAEHRAYGHYFGDTVARDNYPDRIVIYQDTLERDFGHDPDLLRDQVERTLRHELGAPPGLGRARRAGARPLRLALGRLER